jgi:MSHA biogenesis protein MshO
VNTYSLTRKGYPFKTGIMSSGFTLIELIAVIVILSIIATIGTGFVVKTTEAYQRTQTRALLVNTSRQALERMTRQLRIALPYSLQPTNGDNCLKFLPIVGGGNYFEPVPDSINSPLETQIKASAPSIDFGAARYVAIGAMNPDEIYNSGASIARYAGYNTDQLMLTTAKRWLRNSINNRYFLVDNPQAFCVVGNELRFYEEITLNSGDVNLTNGYSILARNIGVKGATDPAFFELANGSENRRTQINISLRLTNAGETILYTQGVFIRNVP